MEQSVIIRLFRWRIVQRCSISQMCRFCNPAGIMVTIFVARLIGMISRVIYGSSIRPRWKQLLNCKLRIPCKTAWIVPFLNTTSMIMKWISEFVVNNETTQFDLATIFVALWMFEWSKSRDNHDVSWFSAFRYQVLKLVVPNCAVWSRCCWIHWGYRQCISSYRISMWQNGNAYAFHVILSRRTWSNINRIKHNLQIRFFGSRLKILQKALSICIALRN